MGFVTTKAKNILQTHILETHYIGLSTTTPTVDGSNISEPGSSTGYERVRIGELDFATKPGQVANKNIIFFNETLASWGTITHFALYESESASSPYFWGELTEDVTINVSGDNTYVPIFRAHALIIGLDRIELDTNYG